MGNDIHKGQLHLINENVGKSKVKGKGSYIGRAGLKQMENRKEWRIIFSPWRKTC
jgi:hypothetical protein